MDFFTMKRKKLQTLCKKHGIPANLKNKEMAEKLSLIYKEEKNENPGSRRLRSDADKSNVEIIVLDSDSDTDVQMEASDTVAEKDSNKTNVSEEYLLDKEPDQFLTTSPLSEVKSDLNIPHTDDSGTAIKISGTSGVKFKSSQKMSITPASEKMIGSSTECRHNSVTLRDVEFCDVEESMVIGVNNEQVDIGLCDLEENLQIGVNKENIDPSEDVMHGESCVAVMSGNEDIQAVSQELDSDLLEGEIANVDDKINILENACGSVKDTDDAVNPGGINSARRSNVNTGLSTDVTGEDIHHEVHSSSFGDSHRTPDQFLPTDLLSEVETSDLDIHKMLVTATASIKTDTSGVKFESSQKMSLSPTSEKMFGSSTKLLNNSGTPRDIGFCDVEENLQVGANKENTDPSDEVLHAEPSLVAMSDNEEVVLEELGNHLMGGEDVNMDDKINLIEDVSGTVDGRDEAVNQEACEEEMLKSSEKNCMVVDREECIGFSLNDLEASNTKGFEAETYFDSTTLGDVMETCNMKGSMQADMVNEEKNQEDCISAEQEVNKLFENSDVHDDIGQVGSEDENQAYSASRKRKRSDVDDNTGANSDEEVEADELVPALPQSSEMESCDFGLQQLFAQNTASSGDQDACQKKLDSPSKATPIASGEKSIIFTTKFNESSMVHKEIEIDMIEENNPDDYISAQREVSKFIDNSDAHADIDRIGAEDKNQAYSVSWKRSDVDDTSGANSDEDLKANELVPAVPQSSEMESCAFGLQQLFAQDTVSSGDQDACQKKLDSPSKATPVASGEKSINSTPKLNDSYMMHKENIDPSEDVMHGESCVAVMSGNEDIQAVSQELDSDLLEGEIANVDDKINILENACVSVKDTDDAVNPGGINSARRSNVNTDMNTDVTGEDILDEVHSSSFEDSDGTSDQFMPTDLLSEVETSDLDVHKMFVTATASKKTDTSEVKFESSQKMSLSPTPEKMFGSSTKLLNNSGTPRDIGFCDVEENLQVGANKENIDPSDEVLHAEPSPVVMSDEEKVVLEELGNYLMGGDDVNMNDKINLIEDVSGTVDCRDEAVNQEAFEEEMLKSSEKTCMVADREECIGFSLNDLEASTTKGVVAETYFDSTTLGDVMETCNMKGSMQADMMDEENRQEDCISAQQEVNMFFENSDVHDDIGRVGSEYENQAYSASRKRKLSDVDDNVGANSDEEVEADELVPAVPQSSEMESCDFGLQQLFAQDTPFSGDQDACQKMLDSPSKATPVASGEKSINVTPKLRESSMMHKEMGIVMMEENNQDDYISAHREVRKFFDNSDVHDDTGRDGAKDEKEAYLASQKRSDVDDTTGASSDEEVKANELVLAVPQSSEMELCDFGVQQLFAQDTASGDEDAIQKKLDSQSKAAPIASGEQNISFSPKFNESSVMNKDMYIDMIKEENNQEGYVSAQHEVSKFLDYSDAHDVTGRDGAIDENQTYSASQKRKRSDVDDTSGANSDEEVKVDEVVPAVLQSSEMKSCNFGLQQLFAQETAFEDEDAHQKKLDSSSKATPMARGEKSIIFTPKLHESSMMNKKMKIGMNLSLNPARDSVGTCDMKENIKTDKEEVSSMISRNKFAKRLPLQDLQQN